MATKKSSTKTKSKAAPSKKKTAAQKSTASSAPKKAATHVNNTKHSMETFMTNTPFQFDKIAQDASDLGQAQMEAAMKCSTTFFKGMEDIMKTCMEMAQDNSEKATEAAKTLMSCKTLNEYTEAQTKVAQASFDDMMAGATKLSEMTVKVCSEAYEPLNDQMSKTIKKASESMAA